VRADADADADSQRDADANRDTDSRTDRDLDGDAVRRAYLPEDFRRLQAIKAVYDRHNMFRINFNIPPQRSSS
jgi:Berberine and berberine like